MTHLQTQGIYISQLITTAPRPAKTLVVSIEEECRTPADVGLGIASVVVFVVGDVVPLAVTIEAATFEEFRHASPERMVALLLKVMSAH